MLTTMDNMENVEVTKEIVTEAEAPAATDVKTEQVKPVMCSPAQCMQVGATFKQSMQMAGAQMLVNVGTTLAVTAITGLGVCVWKGIAHLHQNNKKKRAERRAAKALAKQEASTKAQNVDEEEAEEETVD